MTVTSTAARRTHQGNGSATVFPFDFPITAPADLRVTLTAADGAESLLVEASDYAVSVAAYPGIGSVTCPLGGPPLPAGTRLTLQRELVIDQQVDLQNQGNFYAETHEGVFDRLVMICQQLADAVGRAAKLPVASALADLTFPAPDAGRAVIWNAAADGLANGPSAGEIAAAEGQAVAAAEARQAAEAARDQAEAAAATVGLPPIAGQAGRYLRARSDELGQEYRTAAEVRADIQAAQAGAAQTLAAQPTAPSTGAGEVAVYAKEVDGEPRPYCRLASEGAEVLLIENFVAATNSTQFDHATGSFAPTGLTVTITPRFSGRILVNAQTNGRAMGSSVAAISGAFRLRDVTHGQTLSQSELVLSIGTPGNPVIQGPVHLMGVTSGLALGSPVTFSVEIAVNVGASVSAQFDGRIGTIAAREVST